MEDNAPRTSQYFGMAFPGLPLPQVVQGSDGRRMKPNLDPHYTSEADIQQMQTPHMESRHLLSLLVAIARNPGQRAESRDRKFRAALLLKDLLNSATRGQNLPGVAAVIVGGCALALQHGRVALGDSPFESCAQWARVIDWWQEMLSAGTRLPEEFRNLIENHVNLSCVGNFDLDFLSVMPCDLIQYTAEAFEKTKVERATVGELVAGIVLSVDQQGDRTLLRLAMELIRQWVVALLPVQLAKAADPSSSMSFVDARRTGVRDLRAVGYFDAVLARMQADSCLQVVSQSLRRL